MQLETKFLRLRTPVTLGSRFGDWQDMAGLAAAAISAHPDNETQESAIRKIPTVDEVLAVCAELRSEAKGYEVLRVQASRLRL